MGADVVKVAEGRPGFGARKVRIPVPAAKSFAKITLPLVISTPPSKELLLPLRVRGWLPPCSTLVSKPSPVIVPPSVRSWYGLTTRLLRRLIAWRSVIGVTLCIVSSRTAGVSGVEGPITCRILPASPSDAPLEIRRAPL